MDTHLRRLKEVWEKYQEDRSKSKKIYPGEKEQAAPKAAEPPDKKDYGQGKLF